MIKNKIEQTDTVLVNTEFFFNQETNGGSSISCSGNPKAIEQRKRKNLHMPCIFIDVPEGKDVIIYQFRMT